MTDSTIPHNHVAIIGTGFGGIATAVRLQQDGFHDFVLLERAKYCHGPSPSSDAKDGVLIDDSLEVVQRRAPIDREKRTRTRR